MYIKPAMVRTQDGYVVANVFDPDRKDRLPPEGRDVPESGYWLRRIMEGGVVRVEATKEEHLEPPVEKERIEEPEEKEHTIEN